MKNYDVMATAPKDQLFTLVKSLTKAEKRNFKLYANRSKSSGDLKFIQLFDVMDKLEENDSAVILGKLDGVKRSQLPNLKRHLYKQILISLRLIHIQKNVDIQIREQIDFARILYGKGLYLQSLRLLDRIKMIAIENHQDILHLEILEFQKLIEERHITRSRKIENKVENLVDEALERSEVIHNSCKLSNLKIEVHGFYIQFGHVKNQRDTKIVKDLFKTRLANINQDNLSFFEKVYLNQSYVWYYYTLLDFEKCFEYALKWIGIFEEYPNLKSEEPDLYMRGYHYVLTSLFILKKQKAFAKHIGLFQQFHQDYEKKLNPNSQMLAFLYLNTARLNFHFIDGSFSDGVEIVPNITKQIEKLRDKLDVHRIMVFYFKIAYMHIGNADYDRALDFLNNIIDLKAGHLREDIQCYARILQLICHFELGHYDLLTYLIKSVYRFLEKMKELNKVQLETLRFFSSIITLIDHEKKESYQQFYDQLQILEEDHYEKRAFVYFDILSWVKSKIKKKPFAEMVKKRAK